MKIPGIFSELWDKFISMPFLKKVIIGAIVIGTVLTIFFLMKFFYAKPRAVAVNSVTSTTSTTSGLEVLVPSGAFPKDKRFLIKRISPDSDEYNGLISKWQFDGPIYDIIPKDEKDEWSPKPIKIRYHLPSSLTDIKDVNNVVVKYITDEVPEIERQFYGAEVYVENDIPYIQVISHHFSKIGIEITPVKNITYGLNHVIEKPETLKPHILLVGGIDDNFYSLIPRTVTEKNPQGKNLWEIFFPDRNIWVYRYPLKDTRNLIYTSEFNYYFRDESLKSYIIFEGEKLKQELANTHRDFDIVAQGIGGLIVRYALESGNVVKNVKHVVLMDCPNYGSDLVDMTTFKPFYNMSSKTLADVYYVSTPEIFTILHNTVISYVEKLNTYANEIFPDSNVMKYLNSFGKRKDIKYMAVAGDEPSFSTKIATNTRFAYIYPEIVEGKGDGLVSINSALLKYADVKRIYHHSFSDMYLSNDVIKDIKAFLSDNMKAEKKVTKKKSVSKTSAVIAPNSKVSGEVWKHERIHRDVSLLRKISSINVPRDTDDIDIGNGILWYRSTHSIKRGGIEVFHNDGTNLIAMDVYGRTAVFLDGLKRSIYSLDNGRLSKHILHISDKDLVGVCKAGDSIYTILRNTRGSYVYRLDGNGNLKEVIEMNGAAKGIKYLPSYNEILAYTNTDIALLNRNGSLVTYKLMSSIVKASAKTKIAEEINDVSREGKFLFVLTKGYSVYSFNMINGNAALVTSGDVGNKKLLSIEKYMLIAGERTFNFLDVQNYIRLGGYYELEDNERVINITTYNSHIYTLIEDNNGNKRVDVFSMGI
ncbi:MAG: hypothetical protein J7K51_01570 [Thermotogae bacterium]|nr:hypothetical protein [Thermotogota bacterium]